MNFSSISTKNICARRQQQGVVLVISLIMLLVVTLIAVSSMQGTVMEEKMAGNTRDRNLAFQVAESAVREAEQFVQGIVSMGGFDGSAGLFGFGDVEPYYDTTGTWTSSTQHVSSTQYYGAYEAPRYYIKHLTTVIGTEGAMNMSGYGDNKGTGDVTVFRITARGTGNSADSAEVILRSHFGRMF